ncbi:sulfite exporter TauE/SafE family protein [Haladaptatus sp. F3-133]|uniref:Probable membrane transporter protein n=1 Tax=Halorutilus salinus TaxID=2487751 RepID=A0A9Q4C3E3_9EURY|nr:sulfite exporter TauE/SafE family protein [Halorutilus salinus]MCX2818372.1 sulfite exporter TauE/SafE family protein [Halorutilus salinus]
MNAHRFAGLLVLAFAASVLMVPEVAASDAFTDRFLAHWWVFPASVLFSLVALASGVSGALFFSPFFMLGVGLSAPQAIGAGLLTEVFGMGNGIRSYVKQGVVDYATAKWLLVGAVPATVAGAFAVHYVPEDALRGVFGVGLLVLGGFLFFLRPARGL